MKKLFFLQLFTFNIANNAVSQYIPRMHGMNFSLNYSESLYYGIGYGMINGGYYYKHAEYSVRNKNYYILNDFRILYSPKSDVLNLNFSNSISFELLDWGLNVFGYNFGFDFAYLTNFQKGELQLFPKISFAFYFGTFELTYKRAILRPLSSEFSAPNTFELNIRPFIFWKSEKERWTN